MTRMIRIAITETTFEPIAENAPAGQHAHVPEPNSDLRRRREIIESVRGFPRRTATNSSQQKYAFHPEWNYTIRPSENGPSY